ncbi:MAG: MFS transporter [Holophagales bacterium]|nr:MFS transporter [Holophagales bacterium]
MNAIAQPTPGAVTARLAARGLAILTLINLFNYLDRFVVASLVESLRASELHLTDTQSGALMTGFIVVYMVASPFFGVLGDRGSRPRLLALGVFVWSLATAAAGLARSFASLFAARAAVGIGEAAYGTIAPSLLADYFSKEKRGRVYAIFFCAIPIGSALGYIVGGYADTHLGWRSAFFVAGLPGLLLAFLALTLPDPPRGANEVGEAGEARTEGASPKAGWSSYLALAKNRPFRIAVLGYAAYTFGIGGMAFWMPAFLERVRGVPKEVATVQFGLVVVVTGFVGTFAGGFVGDALLKRTKEAYLWVSGVATLVAVPFAFVALTVPDRSIYLPALVVAQLFVFASTGPINSAIVNDVLPWQRAAAVAACNFTIHVLGDVPSPPLLGALSDASSLQSAVLLVPVAFLVGGAIWTWGALSGRRG